MTDLTKTDITEMQPAGRVVPLYKGDYSDTTSYQVLDVVLYNNSSYIAKQATTGNLPPTVQNSNAYWQLIAKGIIDADVSDATVEFTQATARTNIQSGEDGKTLFGKISKWFADLKTVAFTNSYNDLDNKPLSLKNPNALTFTGSTTGSYDGSVAKSVAIPSVGNGTLTIQKNGTNVQTFTANQGDDATANITVPTSAADVGAVGIAKVLTTPEQINANTDLTNVAGATAVKAMVGEINSNIGKIASAQILQNLDNPEAMFGIVNGWGDDEYLKDFPSDIKYTYGILITVWEWKDSMGDPSATRMQALLYRSKVKTRFGRTGDWNTVSGGWG